MVRDSQNTIDGQRRAELLSFVEEIPFTLRALDYLELYAQMGSQRAVADKRNTAPSSVSETLGRLERAFELSSDMGNRDLRQMIQTGEADALLDSIQELLSAAERMLNIAVSLRSTSTLLVDAFNPHIKLFLAQAIGKFNSMQNTSVALLPRVMGGFRRVAAADLRDKLVSGQSDYIVTALTPGDVLGSADISYEVLYKSRLVIVAPDEHPLMQEREISGDELVAISIENNIGYLVGPDGFLSRDVVQELFRIRGHKYRVQMENPDTNTRVALARSGYGVTIANSDAIDPSFRAPYPTIVCNQVCTSGEVVIAWMRGRVGSLSSSAKTTHRDLLDCVIQAAEDACKTDW